MENLLLHIESIHKLDSLIPAGNLYIEYVTGVNRIISRYWQVNHISSLGKQFVTELMVKTEPVIAIATVCIHIKVITRR